MDARVEEPACHLAHDALLPNPGAMHFSGHEG